MVASENRKHGRQSIQLSDQLREAILSGVFLPGRALRQEEIAQRFSVSRMPVREALRILAAEGLVTQIPNKGAYVSQLTSADIEEIYEMRLSLEAMALQHSIANMTDFHIRQAENVQLRLENAHPNEYGRLNKKFHDILYAPSERKILLSHVSSLGERADRYLRMAIKELDHGMTSNVEHRQLLEACKMRDSKRAIEILQSHIREAGEMLKRYVSDLGENDK